ncbi:hypothetical protein JCM6882_008783 [Rhodosporidiobolus microsporus]
MDDGDQVMDDETLQDPSELTPQERTDGLVKSIEEDDLLAVLVMLTAMDTSEVNFTSSEGSLRPLEAAIAAPALRADIRQLLVEVLLLSGADPVLALPFAQSSGNRSMENLLTSWDHGGRERAITAAELRNMDLVDVEEWLQANLFKEGEPSRREEDQAPPALSVKAEEQDHLNGLDDLVGREASDDTTSLSSTKGTTPQLLRNFLEDRVAPGAVRDILFQSYSSKGEQAAIVELGRGTDPESPTPVLAIPTPFSCLSFRAPLLDARSCAANLPQTSLDAIEQLSRALNPHVASSSTSFIRRAKIEVDFGFLPSREAKLALDLNTEKPAYPDDPILQQRYETFLKAQAGESNDWYSDFFAKLAEFNSFAAAFAKKGSLDAGRAVPPVQPST